MIVGATIENHAARNPAKLALACGNEELYWRDSVALVNQVSNWIAGRTPPKSTIALLLPNCLALPVLTLAIARSGRIAQIFDPAWPDRTVSEMLARHRPALLLVQELRADCAGASTCLGVHAPVRSLAELVTDQSETFDPQAHPEDAFYTGFTSGSTGWPKAFTRNHASWIESFNAEDNEFSITADDVFLAPGSLTHSLFLYAAVRALHAGATAVLAPSFKPSAIAPAARRYAATFLYAVPAQLKLLIAAAKDDRIASVPHVRLVVTSGSKWDGTDRGNLRDVFPNAEFAEFYGASELSFVTVAKESECAPPLSVGRAFSGVEIMIQDQCGNRVRQGNTGQIFVRSKMVFDGYADDIKSASFERSGEYVSVGDMGRLDENGFLFLTGRKDRMIVTAGKNLFPEEIEDVLRMHSAIADAAIVPVPDAKRGSRLNCLLRISGGQYVAKAELVRFARQYLPLYKVPRYYFVVDAWPSTGSGKSDFAALQGLLLSGDKSLQELA